MSKRLHGAAAPNGNKPVRPARPTAGKETAADSPACPPHLLAGLPEGARPTEPTTPERAELYRRLHADFEERLNACQREIEAVCRRHGFRLRVGHVITFVPEGESQPQITEG